MSFGKSTSTGPGRPVVATWNASRTMRGMSCASLINQLCFVTGIVMPTVSHSWNASVPITEYATWPVITTIGTESMYASQSGVTMFVAAGPLVTIATPGRPVACAYPLAMWPANAERFTASLDAGQMERYLLALAPRPDELPAHATIESLSPEKRALLLELGHLIAELHQPSAAAQLVERQQQRLARIVREHVRDDVGLDLIEDAIALREGQLPRLE